MMMRSWFFLLLPILFYSCTKDDNPPIEVPTLSYPIEKGVFGLRDADRLEELGASYTRILVWDSDIEAIYEKVDNGIPLESIEPYMQVKSIADRGVKVILTFRWPDYESIDPALYDRVPVGQDREDALNLLKRFLADFGLLIEIYSLQNEVGGLGPGTYAEADMQDAGNGIPAVEWWKELVSTIEAERKNNANLDHLKISSPTPVLLKRLVFDDTDLPQTNIDFFYETINFANTYCDYLDFHFNTFLLSEYEETIDFLLPLVTVPMISTEWSEVGTANEYKELPISTDVTQLADSLLFNIPLAVTTNDDLIEYLYLNPGPRELWEFMVSESAYEEDFMAASGDLLARANFKILCWNSGWQEGLTAYDLRSFYATKTVAGEENEISLFTTEFKNL